MQRKESWKDVSLAHVKKEYDRISKDLREPFSLKEEKGDAIQAGELKVGQSVRIKPHHHCGTIISLDSDQSRALIMTGNIKLHVNLKDLEAVSEEKPSTQGRSSRDILYHLPENSGREINLIGRRVADALPMIDKMIDRAMIEGNLSLRIIHGHGTGKLKTAIRKHLKDFPGVRKFSAADPESGGEAITLVELR